MVNKDTQLGVVVLGRTATVPISADKLAAIRDRVDIVAVIGRYVELKKRGSRHVGLCPFHNEKTGSFSVSPDKGLYYCFGCHAGGDVLGFIMRHEGLDFHAAVEKLAAEAGVEIEKESPEAQRRRKEEEELVRANDYAAAFFEHELWDASGAPARAYLEKRQLEPEQARAAHLGFGGRPGELLRYLSAKNVDLQLAAKAGMLTEDGKRGLFDGRLIFAIGDARGRIVGFGGRALGDQSTAKYVNSRESLVFQKRRLLYGWSVAHTAIMREKKVVLVEGYMDVLACHEAGIGHAVAALGTALTPEHAETIRRVATDAVVLLDADPAGERGSREAAAHLLAAGLRTFAVTLPPGDDPDSLVRTQGPQALKAAVARAVPFLEHAITAAFAKADMTVEDRVAAAGTLAPLFAALGTGLERDLYLARLAERVGVPAARLAEHLEKEARKHRPKARAAPAAETAEGRTTPKPSAEAGASAELEPAKPAPPAVNAVELRMVRELLLFPQLRASLGKVAELAEDSVTRALLDALVQVEHSVADVVTACVPDPQWQRQLIEARPMNGPEADLAERGQRTLDDVLNRLRIRQLDKVLQEVLLELKEVESQSGETEELIRRKQDLTRRRNALKNRLLS